MIDIESVGTELARQTALRTTRRSFISRVGIALILASTGFAVRSSSVRASCSSCGGCSPLNCGQQSNCGGACCSCSSPNYECSPCGGVWCTLDSNKNCPSPYTNGWYWYCCYSPHNTGQLWLCQDCCSGNGNCVCTGKVQVGIC
jgi:hypothetical protein